jgi:glutamate synthase domain-containing protein 2/Na+-translocating ferredoxin:NAD+ oxidoreductase RNF subunit RnfB
MPKKYHITPRTTPPRFSPISKMSAFEVKKCLKCRRCVKDSACIYGVYHAQKFDPLVIQDTHDNLCLSCFRCVQECKNDIMLRSLNPRWQRLGSDYWTPEIITSIWKQAETGKIPVSGAGYRGRFSGPGFDEIWTDMSEIVRPTRDGIHGREYISTGIELGRKPARLIFDASGQMTTQMPPVVAIPVPFILDMPPFGFIGHSTREAMAQAAVALQTVSVATLDQALGPLARYRDALIVKFDPKTDDVNALAGIRLLELSYQENVLADIAAIKNTHPRIIISVRLNLDENAAQQARELAQNGVDIIQLEADPQGNGMGAKQDTFVTALTREVHLALVKDSVREQVTVLVSGGISMAEHMAKIIICGADGVGVDLALLVAMECRLCADCEMQAACPVDLDKVPEKRGAQRIVNLMASWHSQLIEVLGAMGLREVRRLRGEVGRAMFFNDLENEIFAPIFDDKNGDEQTSAAISRGAEKIDLEPWQFAGIDLGHKPTESRYRNQLNKYRVMITRNCDHCGKCVDACRHGVLIKKAQHLQTPKAHLCHGQKHCEKEGSFCVDHCPQEAIRVSINPLWKTFGDPRWTADLIAATWHQAESGRPPDDTGLKYKKGASGGGFDKMEFVFPATPPDSTLKPEKIDLAIPLNRRDDDNRPEVVIGFPIYGGGMSFGSISLATMVARAKAYKAFSSFTCSGEGGYPDALKPYDDHVITQVATGLFGVTEETIQRVRIVEFKYAQGAKPGLGGHLLGDKVTPAVAEMRQAVVGSALFSPFPFHSVYSVEDHKKHVDWIKHVNPNVLVSVKVSTPTDVDMVAVGSYYAGAHIIHIDGSYGGTGAAPDIAKKNIAMPIEYAIPKVHQFLEAEGIREKMTLIASGGIRSAWDVAKAIALGADGVVMGTAELVALECIRCGNCESGRGCPRGIATTDAELAKTYDVAWATRRLVNLFHAYAIQLQEILWRLGLKNIKQLVGRTDLITHTDYKRN